MFSQLRMRTTSMTHVLGVWKRIRYASNHSGSTNCRFEISSMQLQAPRQMTRTQLLSAVSVCMALCVAVITVERSAVMSAGDHRREVELVSSSPLQSFLSGRDGGRGAVEQQRVRQAARRVSAAAASPVLTSRKLQWVPLRKSRMFSNCTPHIATS